MHRDPFDAFLVATLHGLDPLRFALRVVLGDETVAFGDCFCRQVAPARFVSETAHHICGTVSTGSNRRRKVVQGATSAFRPLPQATPATRTTLACSTTLACGAALASSTTTA